MNILVWVIFGALVGWIASIIAGTDERQGGLANIIIGITGALIGGFAARALGTEGITGFNSTSFLVALFGATLLIITLKALRS